MLARRGPARPRGRRLPSRSATSTTLAVPETLTALIARAPRRPRAGRPGARLRTPPSSARASRSAGLAAVVGRSTRPSSSRACARSSGASCSPSRPTRARPERGQYAFVQALIREVAYNTLAQARPQGPPPRRGPLLRAPRHRRAGRRPRRPLPRRPRERAGGPGGRRARRPGPDRPARPRPSGPSRSARTSRRSTFLEQALTVTTDPAEEAELLERAGESASAAGPPRRGRGAPAARRSSCTASAATGRRRPGRPPRSAAPSSTAYRTAEALARPRAGGRRSSPTSATTRGSSPCSSQLARAVHAHEEPARAIEVADRVLDGGRARRLVAAPRRHAGHEGHGPRQPRPRLRRDRRDRGGARLAEAHG